MGNVSQTLDLYEKIKDLKDRVQFFSRMYKSFLFIVFIAFSLTTFPQANKIDSLKMLLSTATEDSNKVNVLLQLSRLYLASSPDDAMKYSVQARDMAQQIGYYPGIAFALKNIGMVHYNRTNYAETIDAWRQSQSLFESTGDKANAALLLNNIGSVYMNQGDDAKALDYFFKSLKLAEQSGDKHKVSLALGNIGTIYSGNKLTYDKALEYYLKALAISEELDDENIMNVRGGLLVNIGETYLNRDKDDSALYYFERSLKAYENTENIPYSLNDIGKTYTKKGNYKLAEQYHENAISFAIKFDLQLDIAQSYLGLGDMYYKKGDFRQALIAYDNAHTISKKMDLKKELKDSYQGLAISYAAIKDFSKAFKYQTLFTNIKDTLYNLEIAEKLNNLQTNFEIQKKQGEIDILTKDKALQKLELQRQKYVRNTLGIGLLLVFVVTFLLFKLYRKVGRRTVQLRRSLDELKATQAQLIQSEKMASLGSLTAGIGHEIQNPLNFVNNFSEVNVELLHELQEGPLKKLSDADKVLVEEIMNDLSQNMEKINQHGKRADSIVKGMLQHTRVSTSKKEPTDLNDLADEYLRMSYQGLRAKDSSVNISLKTFFDAAVKEIDIIPQDISRVLLNLYNNAFYAVIEKKIALQKAKNDVAYEPIVSVSTKGLKSPHGLLKEGDSLVLITVKDNGSGIPENVVNKIFQPFFTTKPTGQGTGLGLSLSYDIIKAHGGDITVNTRVGEGTEFVISLPSA